MIMDDNELPPVLPDDFHPEADDPRLDSQNLEDPQHLHGILLWFCNMIVMKRWQKASLITNIQMTPSIVRNPLSPALEASGEEVNIYLKQNRSKALSKHCQVRDDIFISNFEGLSLKQYRNVVLSICQKEHIQPCSHCEGLSKVAGEVIACGFMKLKSVFQLMSPGVLQYKASEARRKLTNAIGMYRCQ